jgi:integrase
MNNSAWQKARVTAGLSMVRVRDLRHTYATRLRAAGIAQEVRATLLVHATKTMAEHYAAADIGRLITLSNSSLDRSRTRTILNVVNS